MKARLKAINFQGLFFNLAGGLDTLETNE